MAGPQKGLLNDTFEWGKHLKAGGKRHHWSQERMKERGDIDERVAEAECFETKKQPEKVG